jgi:hypothetical protein
MQTLHYIGEIRKFRPLNVELRCVLRGRLGADVMREA